MMEKKCHICDKPAKFKISGTSDFYCEECAIEFFGDLSCLVEIEQEAKRLKKYLDEKIDDFERNEDDAFEMNDN